MMAANGVGGAAEAFRLHPVRFPLYVWDHERFPSAEVIPENVRGLFPGLEMPHCQVYLMAETCFGVGDREMETLALLRSYGLNELEFGPTRFDTTTVSLADAGATIALHNWQMAVFEGGKDLARIAMARELLEQSVADGGVIDFASIVEAIGDHPEFCGVIEATLNIAIAQGASAAQRFRALAGAREILAGYSSDDPFVLAELDGLCRRVDLLSSMEAGRTDGEAPPLGRS
jgi:hypothetical protein